MGYNGNSLYLYCLGDVIPFGKDMLVVHKNPFDQKRIEKFSRKVLKGKVFGFAKVDLKYLTSFMRSLVRCHHCLLFKRFLIVTYLKKWKSIRKELEEKHWKGQKSYWVLWKQRRSSCSCPSLNDIYNMGWGWQRFINWLNTNQACFFHGFQRSWEMPGARQIKIPWKKIWMMLPN